MTSNFRKIRSIFRRTNGRTRGHGGDMLFGQFLKHRGRVTEEQIEAALKHQKDMRARTGETTTIGRIMADMGFISEQELLEAVIDYYDIPIDSISGNIRGALEKLRHVIPEEIHPPRIPIWFRLALIMGCLLLSAIVGMSALTFNRQQEKLYKQAIDMGMVSLNFFGSNAVVPLLEDNILALNTLLKNTEGVNGHLYAFILNNDLEILAHTDQSKIGTVFTPFTPIDTVHTLGNARYFNYVGPGNRLVLDMTQPIVFKDKVLGEVHVGLSIDFLRQLFLDEKSFLVAITLIILCVGLFVAVLLGIGFSRPISELVKATREIAQGNYDYKVNVKRRDELGTLARAFNRMAVELSRQSVMKESFGKYVGAEVLDMIMHNPETTWLKGRKNDASILFADIRGFTAYSETKDPETLVEKLNEYFEIATRVILKHGGYVDKFIGDAVLGVFGVPVISEDHAERCIRAALDMQKEFEKAAARNGNRLLARVGIGIKSGVVVAGNIGSQSKMEYTVIGDSVNIASKLNDFAMPGEIIVDHSIISRLEKRLTAIQLAPQKIKGRAGLVEIYKITGLKDGNA